MASQLDQLLGYLDRPGVTEVALSPGRPITMTTPKGVVNVTGRSLSFDQLASIVRGTPLEALIADETSGSEPVQLTLGKRDVMIAIDRAGDSLTVRLQGADVAKARTRTKPRGATSPPSDKLKPPARPAPKAEELPIDLNVNVDDLLLPPGTAMPALPADELPSRPRSSSIAPPLPTGPHPNDMRPRSPSVSPFAGLPITSSPPVSPLSLELPMRPPPPAPLDPSTSPVVATPPAASRGSGNKLRINVSALADAPSSVSSDASGMIPLARPRTLDALGLRADIATHLRERSLVVIAASPGHGKTSTLAVLVDILDRSAVTNVVTVDELRDRESVDFAITAVESGYLVLATITAPTAAAAIDRIVDQYPGMAHGRVKTRLIGSVGAVIGKRLPPTPSEIVTGAALRTLLGN